MSISQQAVILIRLDARRGEVVPVADLAAHMGVSADTVRSRIDELWRQGYLEPRWDTAGTATVITGAVVTRALPKCA